jgi:Flp pilus assembly protein TadD
MTSTNYSALSTERKLLSVPVLLAVLVFGIPTVVFAQDVVARSAVQLHIDQSIAYYTHGDLRQAIGELQVAQQLAPADPQVNFMLGNALYRYGDNAGAAEAYGKALAIKPDHFEAHMSRGFALFETGAIEQAVAEWAAAKRIEPREPFARAALAVGLYALGRLDDAKVQYSGALALSQRYGKLDSLRVDIRWKAKALGTAGRVLELLHAGGESSIDTTQVH